MRSQTLKSIALPALIVGLLCLWVFLDRVPQQGQGSVTLRWVVNSGEGDQIFVQAAKRAFEARHPHISLQLIKQNEGRKVETMIAGGDAPDIINVGMDRIPYFTEAKVLRDLSSFLSPQDRADLQQFFPVTLPPVQKGETLYALPWGYVPFILFYNKNLFDKYAVPYPKEGWTWEDYRKTARLLTHDTDKDGATDEFGASFAQWQDGYYCWFYQNGGRVVSEDNQRATFDSPRVIEALAFLQSLTRQDRVIPTETNKPRSVGMGLFEAGKMAMHGPTGSFYIPAYRKYERVDWDIADVPAGNNGKGTIVAPLYFGVTAQSKHPKEAWELVRFLCGEEGQKILADSGLFVPCRRDVALSSEFLKAEGAPKNRYALVSMMDDRNGKKPWAILRPWSGNRWGDGEEILNSRLSSFLFGEPKAGETPESVAKDINAQVNAILAEDRASYQGTPMQWRVVMVLAGAGLLIGGGFWLRALRAYGKGSRRKRTEQAYGYLAISPWLIGFLLLSLGPILFSIVLSFTRWNSLAPPDTARFVGVDNYANLLSGKDPFFFKSLKATLLYAVLSLPLSLSGGLLLALLMNSRLKGIALFRTLYYLPAVMPLVATAVLFGWIFRQQGLLNYLLGGFGTVPFSNMPNWTGAPQWAVPAIVLMGLWGIGGGMMIYLAGLQNIPTQLYEAAQLDGAGVLSQFRHITLPMLSPTLFFNLVMGVIGAFQVFSSAFVLFGSSSGPDDSALFYSFYLYRKAFEQFQIGYGSALAWILFLLILVCTALIFRSSALWVYYEGEKEEAK